MLLLILLSLAAPAADGPYWRTREDLYQRVKDGEVIVSANSKVADSTHRKLTIRGGGRVRAPAAFAYEFARDFDRIARLSGYVERSEYKNERLRVTFAALGTRADLVIKVTRDDAARRVHFDITAGPLAGLNADLKFDGVGANASDVGIDGEFIYQNKLKNALVGVGLEGVFKLMAARLRDAVERARKGVDNAPPGVKGSAA